MGIEWNGPFASGNSLISFVEFPCDSNSCVQVLGKAATSMSQFIYMTKPYLVLHCLPFNL